MGARTWMLAYASENPRTVLMNSPVLNEDASMRLARKLFPSEKLKPLGRGDMSFTSPPDNELLIGSFDGLSIIAAKEFGIDHPSKLGLSFLTSEEGRNVYLHAMHSVVDWFAFGVWTSGKLLRSLSLSPDSGILEDIGSKLPFEESFWAGQHPALEPGEEDEEEYPFPFHPLDLGEAALKEFFGYQLEGPINPELLQPERIPLLRLERPRQWWKFW